MVMKKNRDHALYLFMNEKLVGTLEKKSLLLTFTYDSHWLNTPGARPISLSLPLVAQKFSGDIVYHFFDNLLPDNANVRSRIQQCFHTNTDHPFDLLEAIGHDCVGAIQLQKNNRVNFSNTLQYQSLTNKKIAALLRNTQIHPLGMLDNTDDFRISIAGAQEKSALLYWNKKWNRPEGSTPTTHIVKLPIGTIAHQSLDLSDSCENEWVCAQIAKALELPAAHCDIKQFDDVKTLVVTRFDRKLSQDKKRILRLPQEDMCQALGISSHLKYQSDGGPGIKEIMQLLLGSAEPEKDRDHFFSAQILFWLLAAIDGHAKNFSIFLEPHGQYRLTPLYDIMSAYPLIAKKQLHPRKMKMAMALLGENKHYHWFDLKRRYFLTTAKKVHYSEEKAEALLDNILDKIDFAIEQVSRKIPNRTLQQIADPIFEGLLLTKQKLMR